jgi:vacuolar-type H+-ATPase subunit E/Vma4
MSEQKIKEEILKDARAKADKILAKARSTEEAILLGAKNKALDYYNTAIAEAQTRAEQEKKRIFGNLPLEEQRIVRRARENVIEKAIQEALQIISLGEKFDYPASLKLLIMEGALALGEDVIICRIRKEDQQILSEAFVKSIQDEISTQSHNKAKIRIVVDEGQRRAGVILESADSRKVFDNTYHARFKRMKDEIRLKIAELLNLL